MLDCATASLTYMAQNVLATGESPKRMGSRHPSIVPYQAFPTRDGFIVVAAGSQPIWDRLCLALGRPELAGDPRFTDNPKRVANRDALEGILNSVFATRSTTDWVTQLQAHDIPATPVNDLTAALDLPPLLDRGMIQPSFVGSPVARDRPHRRAPRLGEHNDEILRELGFDGGRIAQLRATGIV
jgi:crotonobetainyl-CoA:carnitine CoA-transferase CaiB-like acyl-CoA transferase